MARIPAAGQIAVTLVGLAISFSACSGAPSAPPSEVALATPTLTPSPTAIVPPAASATQIPEATPVPVATPAPTPTPPVVKVPGRSEVYRFGPDMTSGDRGRVREWTAYGVALQERMLGRRFTRFTILASHDPRWLAKEDCRTRPPGMPNCIAQQTEIYRGSLMGGCHPAPVAVACAVVASLDVRGLDTAAFRGLQFAHEAHHVFHGQVYPSAWRATQVPPDQVWSTGPVWLLEGAANFIGWQVQFQRGLMSYETERAEWEEWSRRIDLPLQRLETLAVSDRTVNAYHLYSLALDELMKLVPAGPRAITTYYEATARGTSWKVAFRRAFGMSVATFYKRFAAIRAGLPGG